MTLKDRVKGLWRDSGNDTSQSSGKAAARNARHREEKQMQAERREADANELASRREREDEAVRRDESDEMLQRYGDASSSHCLADISALDDIHDLGKQVTVRARIHAIRPLSTSLTFVILRYKETSVQAVVHDDASEHMIKWVQRLPLESLVQVGGTVSKPREPVQSTTTRDFEITVDSIHLINQAQHVPFSVDASQPVHKRLDNRIIDLRHPSNHAIFKIRARFLQEFRKGLDGLGFLEINTPKLQAAATESGAQVFKVNYFGREAFLAQSPQLAKQMAISADLGRVYEIGPVFRAENSNTHRHLTEYTGLDIEMPLRHDYHEVVDILLSILRSTLDAIMGMRAEIDKVRQRWPSTDLVLSESIPIIPFPEGIQMLRDAGEDVKLQDLSTPHEIKLGELVKTKYHTDFYVLDKFPASARPFYTHLDEDNPDMTNSFDMFLRGQEICTGGQRISDPKQLRKAMSDAEIDESTMSEYLQAFDWGIPPHAGAGLGLDRIIFLALDLGNVRYASLFPRDPKSLPAKPPSLAHPEASTLRHHDEPPCVEDLIANYGDATNTSWLDARFTIWRHDSGAAIGYSPRKHIVIIAGDPLCEEQQYEIVVSAFLDFVKNDIKLSPVWLLVSDRIQSILAREHGWRSLVCTEEQRLDEKATGSADQAHEINRMKKQGVSLRSLDPDDQLRVKIDQRIDEWKAHRSSGRKQVHLTEIAPWQDTRHRKYFIAESNEVPQALVVLAQLSQQHGWQVKWALDFADAPNGAIDALIHFALSAVQGQPITFGSGVADSLVPVHHIHGLRSRILSRTYEGIVKSLRLRQKAQFREKFGTFGDSTYFCYPKHGISPLNAKEVIGFFEE